MLIVSEGSDMECPPAVVENCRADAPLRSVLHNQVDYNLASSGRGLFVHELITYNWRPMNFLIWTHFLFQSKNTNQFMLVIMTAKRLVKSRRNFKFTLKTNQLRRGVKLLYNQHMKSKKNRNKFENCYGGVACKQNLPGSQLKVRFDILSNDISCFFPKKADSKLPGRRASKSQHGDRRPASIKKPATGPSQSGRQVLEQTRNREESPDLIRECSNTILSKIQKSGLSFSWEEESGGVEENRELNFQEARTLWDAFSQHSKSYASTSDFPSYQLNAVTWQKPPERQYTTASGSFTVAPECIPLDWRTTLMIRNIPNRYNIDELSQQIDIEHRNAYDFLYLPCDLKNQCNVGYGFINFTSTQNLSSFYHKFNNYSWRKYRSEKICCLTYARLQGLDQLIDHFENSKIMSQKDRKYRPIIRMQQIHKMVYSQQNTS